MKSIKPKRMSKAAERTLCVGAETAGNWLSPRQCRDVLAALEYERRRAEEAEKKANAAALEVDKGRAELSIYKPSHWHD